MPLFGQQKEEAPAQPDANGKKQYDTLPDGTHQAEAKFTKAGVTKSNKPKVSVLWVDSTGRGAWQNITVPVDGASQKHVEVFYKQLASLGLTKDVVDSYEDVTQLANDIKGAKAIVTVQTDQYGPKVTWVSEPV